MVVQQYNNYIFSNMLVILMRKSISPVGRKIISFFSQCDSFADINETKSYYLFLFIFYSESEENYVFVFSNLKRILSYL